ncbi:DASH family cryptochrome [Crocosphaera sp. UHCC 0190]|uniref:DASH family cryptochrome n=1 Tax=Crocosphaera sp. UHCC 0190 TaxID=3110246 RepID=UPI002B21125E|nr:DASH family cryptochrome [Crocosphaera sp. UHCC 0190]MEA5511304.1 DASH family cryptochrome [Crocosphaera sp. UHCC 0190]
MSNKTILIWYRNDLRIHDHEALGQAIQEKALIIPFYCFDTRQFQTTSCGFPKTGNFRGKFLLESLDNLKKSLQKAGSDLIIRKGYPENIIPQLVKELSIDTVYFHQEVTAEEINIEKALQQNLSSLGVKFQGFWGSTLYHWDNLPFKVDQIPELFTNFRKKVEKNSTINPTFPTPKTLPKLPEIDLGKIPSIEELGLQNSIFDTRSVLNFKGGETEGIKRVNNYFWDNNCLKNYKETRNGMLGTDYSSKLSPWLAKGCLSPRYIYEEVQKYEEERVKNNSTYWLIFELLWRDYFRFICAKHGNKIFYPSGLQGLEIPWKEDSERFRLWQEGKTGYPLVDANMRELSATGFMSNRGRQNVASFLTKNLGINWIMGAEWFESLLIDYDVCSNYGNWNYTAGVGNDARGFRYFNITKQSKDYDPKGDYLKHWLPELKAIPGDKIHEPWQLSPEEQKRYNVIIGVNYPRPIVDFFTSVKANEKVYNQACS